jgi:glycosyltransferase involved in cell wall biosynthesis
LLRFGEKAKRFAVECQSPDVKSRHIKGTCIVKLVIQIPCFNEEHCLATALAALPREIPGISEIEVLVIDDGSEDRTAEIARANGATVHSLGVHCGLAAAFTAGLRQALRRGADIVVNTDADNQYEAADIPALIEPIVARQADLVLGDREVATEEFFSPIKRILQKIGSEVVGLAVGVKVPDATSGFRAFSRAAASRVLVLSKYSYTLETLIQAAALKQRIKFVPVRTNPPTRPSRLMRSQFEYVRRSAVIILRSFAIYHPVKTLLTSTGVFSSFVIAGLATDINEMVATAAVFQSLTLVGFVPLYQKHRAALHRAEEQAGSLEPATAIECATVSGV